MRWFFSYSYQMVAEAVIVKDALYQAFDGRGWEINGLPAAGQHAGHFLTDGQALRPGDFWSHKLLDWLHTCDGGILFFTRDETLDGRVWEQQIEKRRWLYIEAFLLIVRKVRGELNRCIPVYVDTEMDAHPVARFIRQDLPDLQGKTLATPPNPAQLQALIDELEVDTPAAEPAPILPSDDQPQGEDDDAFDELIRCFVREVREPAKERAVLMSLKGTTNEGMLAAPDRQARLQIRLDSIRGGRPTEQIDRKKCLDLAVAELIVGGPMHGDTRLSPHSCALIYRIMMRYLIEDFLLGGARKSGLENVQRVQEGKSAVSTKWVSPIAMRGLAGALGNGARIFVIGDEAILDGKEVTPVAPAERLAILDELIDAGKCLGSTDENTNLNDLANRIAPVCRRRPTVSYQDDVLVTKVYHIEGQDTELAEVISDVGGLLDRRFDPTDPVVVIDSTGYLLANVKQNTQAATRRGGIPEDAAANAPTRLDVFMAACRKKFPFEGLTGFEGEPPFDPLFVFSFATDLTRDRFAELGLAGAQLVTLDLAWRAKLKTLLQ